MFIFYPQLLYLFIIPYFRSFPKRKKVWKFSRLNEDSNIPIQELE
ncbi:conserved domain protein [Streptococcus mitis SK1080]|uniref:Conserved domain protein n=1 Tax=Streptococcus mitis SK1080 TaxID=1008453 RepID=F9HLH5_STRMT|nr:conserved domain protein [Streptococcus mitis SK1080]